jgi:hypothetical protein
LVGPLVGWSVCPHIILNVIFSAACGGINLKFARDLHGHLLCETFNVSLYTYRICKLVS